MNTFKKFFIRVLFTKEQRRVIADSLNYSEYKYRQHENIDDAIRVGIVRKEVIPAFTVDSSKKKDEKMTFTHDEVVKIVSVFLKRFVDYASELYERRNNSSADNYCILSKGVIISEEKCNECKNKAKCMIHHILFSSKNEEGVEKNETDEKDTQETNTEEN